MSAPGPRQDRRDQRRPLELLGLSAILALVVGAVLFMVTRSFETAGIWAGVSFIVIVVFVAMLVLTTNPEAGRRDDDDEDRPAGH